MSTFADKIRKLDELKKRLSSGEECVDFVIRGGGLAELFSFLPSYEAKDGTDNGVIDSTLESLLKISINCFYTSVSKQNQSICIDELKKVNGYNILILLRKTYFTEKFKDHISIILGRFHDGISLPTDFETIIPNLKNIISKNSSTDTSKALYYVNLALVSLTSIANYFDNKKLLILHDVQSVVLPLLTSSNSNVAVHSLTLLSNFCSVGSADVKNKIIQHGIFQHFLPLLHYFSQNLPLNPASPNSAIPVATTINNVCALIGMLISENEVGIEKFIRSGIIPLFCILLASPPSSVVVEDFERIACNMLNTFVVSAAQKLSQALFLLTFPKLFQLVVDVVKANPSPEAEAPLVFAAIKVLYTFALKGAEGDEEHKSPTNVFKETIDALEALPVLHHVLQHLNSIPSNTLAASQVDAIRQSALAVGLYLKGTEPDLAQYEDVITVLKTLKTLPAPSSGLPATKLEEYHAGAELALVGMSFCEE